MMKPILLVATMLVAAAAGAMARGLKTETTPLCQPCPSNFNALYPFGNAGLCPLCYKQPTPQCGTKYAKAVCCGGDTGVTCPTIACSTSSSYAVSGPTGCAIASSTMSSLAVSNTTFNMRYVYKTVFDDFCGVIPTTVEGGGWTNMTRYIQVKASYLSQVIAEATAKTFVNYQGYACTCAKCGSSCTSNNNQAKTIIGAQVAAVAQACASTWLDAVADVVETGCIGTGAEAYAVAHADAMASSIEYVINTVYNQAYSINNNNSMCGVICSTTEIQKAVARAIACGYVDVFAKIRDSKYEYLSTDAAGNVNATSTQTTVAEAFSCSTTMALSGSKAGSGTWSSTSGQAPSYDWTVTCPISCPNPTTGCPSFIDPAYA